MKSKCNKCKKKLSLIYFTCKCGNTYCIAHQIPHKHNCTFDYLNENKQKIKKNNPKIENIMNKNLLK